MSNVFRVKCFGGFPPTSSAPGTHGADGSDEYLTCLIPNANCTKLEFVSFSFQICISFIRKGRLTINKTVRADCFTAHWVVCSCQKWKVSELDGSRTGEVVLYYGVDEQVRRNTCQTSIKTDILL